MIKEQQSASGRADQLQFLRYIAFSFIFLLHAQQWNFVGFPAGNGAAEAVGFFIMLSGLVAGYSGYGKTVTLTLRAVARYMGRKIAKVYPLYLFALLYAICASAMPAAVASHDWQTLAQQAPGLLGHLLLLQSWIPQGYFGYTGVGWFLSTILFLYLFHLPALALLEKIGRGNSRGVFAAIMAALAVAVALYAYAIRTWNMEFWGYIFPPARLGEYLMGMTLGYAIRAGERREQPRIDVRFTALEIAALAVWLGALFVPVGGWLYRIVFWLLPNLFVLTVFTIGKGRLSRLFAAPPLCLLGDVSFECFLLHRMILQVYERQSGLDGAVSKLGCLFSLAFCLWLTTHLAWLIHRGREKA